MAVCPSWQQASFHFLNVDHSVSSGHKRSANGFRVVDQGPKRRGTCAAPCAGRAANDSSPCRAATSRRVGYEETWPNVSSVRHGTPHVVVEAAASAAPATTPRRDVERVRRPRGDALGTFRVSEVVVVAELTPWPSADERCTSGSRARGRSGDVRRRRGRGSERRPAVGSRIRSVGSSVRLARADLASARIRHAHHLGAEKARDDDLRSAERAGRRGCRCGRHRGSRRRRRRARRSPGGGGLAVARRLGDPSGPRHRSEAGGHSVARRAHALAAAEREGQDEGCQSRDSHLFLSLSSYS
jgi:hypothetical protein